VKKGRAVSGWLVVDKPAGVTSTAVVNKVKWALSAQKAGHAGTLDPDATGVLAVALGEATKTIPYITDALKCYRFRVVLGAATETDDASGAVIATSAERPTDARSRPRWRRSGATSQVPPQYSAVKVDGERAYDLAREGEVMDLAARPLWVERLVMLGRPDADHVDLEMVCGKGGYVRSIARDLGQALGVPWPCGMAAPGMVGAVRCRSGRDAWPRSTPRRRPTRWTPGFFRWSWACRTCPNSPRPRKVRRGCERQSGAGDRPCRLGHRGLGQPERSGRGRGALSRRGIAPKPRLQPLILHPLFRPDGRHRLAKKAVRRDERPLNAPPTGHLRSAGNRVTGCDFGCLRRFHDQTFPSEPKGRIKIWQRNRQALIWFLW
jgi:tRNA pseudouridine(55) synthase